MEAEVRPSPLPSAAPSTEATYTALSTYTFTLDPEFQAGLTSLTSGLSGAQLEETILQAQCFYFARKFNLPPIDDEDYKAWLVARGDPSQQEAAPATHIAAQPLSQASSGVTNIAPKEADGPPYPASFESIVDLITRNQPIPGIEEIPDTVLDASFSAPNQTARRKKPWETDEVRNDVKPVLGDAVAVDGKPTGVVGILQPIKKLEEGDVTNDGATNENAEFDGKVEGLETHRDHAQPKLEDAMGE